MKLKQKLKQNRDQILAIAEKHGAFNVRIFGSVAKELETEASDVDFLVDYDLSKVSPWFPGGLLMDLQDLLGCKVDIASDRGLSKFIKARILKEAKSL